MNHYRNSVILFGIAAPALVAALVIGLCIHGGQRIRTSLADKVEHFAEAEQTRRAVAHAEAEIAPELENLARWDNRLTQDTSSTVTGHLREIAERLPEGEFQQTSFERPEGSAGFGAASAQKSSHIRLSFRGTYRSLQRAFLELETLMPQLLLQEIRISPHPNQPSMLNVQLAYTAWEE